MYWGSFKEYCWHTLKYYLKKKEKKKAHIFKVKQNTFFKYQRGRVGTNNLENIGMFCKRVGDIVIFNDNIWESWSVYSKKEITLTRLK